MANDEAKVQQLLGKMLGEVCAAMGIGIVLLGDKFGLYKALGAQAGETRLREVILRRILERAARHRHPIQSGAGSAASSVIRDGRHLKRREGRVRSGRFRVLTVVDSSRGSVCCS
jgi:hypothetical protein